MVIVVYCNGCGSKLNAKDELRGEIRNCPKCRKPILIEEEPPKEEPVEITDDMLIPPPTEGITMTLPTGPVIGGENVDRPFRLDFNNRYFVLGHDRLIAVWESGKGWLVNVGGGFASAKKNVGAIPDQGTFILVELMIAETELGRTPVGLRLFRIIKRGALTALYRDESEILGVIEGAGSLSKPQKSVLLGYLQRNFMQTFFDNDPRIMDFLTNDDTTGNGVPQL